MNELDFKKQNKMAACSAPPWAIFIPVRQRPEILRIIRQECIDIYGYSFDECPKRLTCFKKTCLGRPLPWLSPTAQPYLEQLKQSQNIVNDELVIETDCSVCPIFAICKNPCNQILDFIDRDKVTEVQIHYKDDTDDIKAAVEALEPANFIVSGKDIPWDILPMRKQQLVRKYLYENRDFRYLGTLLNINNQARAKYEFYSAITKLSEYGTIRSFLKSNIEELTNRQKEIFEMVYFNNKSFTQVAKILGISKQSVQQTVSKVIKKHNITWKVYVRKQGNKVVYSNIPRMFKEL